MLVPLQANSSRSHPWYAVVLQKVITPQAVGTYVEPIVAWMVAAFCVIDLLQGCKVTGAVDPHKLRIAIVAHINLYKVAYGEDAIRFKHHCAIHLPDMLERWGNCQAP